MGSLQSFPLTTDPVAHVNELKYIAALLQTCEPHVRENGTISSVDIQRFCMSRYGLVLNHDEHALDVIRALGGGNAPDKVKKKILAQRLVDQKMENLENRRKFGILGMAGIHLDKLTPTKLKSKKGKAPEPPPAEVEDETHHKFTVETPVMEYWDLVQLASILVIPEVLQICKRWKVGKPIHAPDTSNMNGASEEHNTSTSEASEVMIIRTALKVLLSTLEGPERSRNMKTDGTPDDASDDIDDIEDFESAHQNEDSIRGEGSNAEQPQDDRTKATSIKFFQEPMADAYRRFRGLFHSPKDKDDGIRIPYAFEQNAPPLTAALVQRLLHLAGEHERAQDTILIEEMVNVASSASGTLDEDALMNAISSDVQQFNTQWITNRSTYVKDIFGDGDLRSFERELNFTEQVENDVAEDLEASESPLVHGDDKSKHIAEKPQIIRKVKQAIHFDATIDSFASTFTLLATWAFYMFFSFLLVSILGAAGFSNVPCNRAQYGNFWCTIYETVISWFLFAVLLSFLGIGVSPGISRVHKKNPFIMNALC